MIEIEETIDRLVEEDEFRDLPDFVKRKINKKKSNTVDQDTDLYVPTRLLRCPECGASQWDKVKGSTTGQKMLELHCRECGHVEYSFGKSAYREARKKMDYMFRGLRRKI